MNRGGLWSLTFLMRLSGCMLTHGIGVTPFVRLAKHYRLPE